MFDTIMRSNFSLSDTVFAMDYSKRHSKRTRVKWAVSASLTMFLVGVVFMYSGYFGKLFAKGVYDVDTVSSLEIKQEQDFVPLSDGTSFHHVFDAADHHVWKRSSHTSVSGDLSGRESSSGNSETTTAPAGGEHTISGEGSAEVTSSSITDAHESDVTTESMFGASGSGELTTIAPDETTLSGDDHTSPTEMSGIGTMTTEMSIAQTVTMEMSGAETMTMEMSGAETMTMEMSSEDPTEPIDMSGTSEPVTVDISTDESTEGDIGTTTEATTVFEATTGEALPIDDGLLVPLWVAIVLLIVGIIVGVLLVIGVQALLKYFKSRKSVTPINSPRGSHVSLGDQPAVPNWLLAREDSLMKAMAMGQIAVLQFALSESRAAGLMQENPNLMRDAENKLNSWKRTKTQLETAYREKDLDSMDEFMNRFRELEMKDDTGTYQRCVDLKWNMKHAELNMVNATEARDGAMLMSATGQYEALQLPPAVMLANVPYQNAKRVMEEVRREKLLEGQSHHVIISDLRTAVLSRNPAVITAALDKFIKSGIPDTYDDIGSANRTLEMIENERKDHLDMATKKLEDASISRDQNALREAIEECKKFGSSDEELKTPQQLLRVIEHEDKLLAELRDLTADGDIAKLEAAIVVFKTPTINMVDKTGDLKNAEETLSKLQQKERMRKTKEDVGWRLKNAMAIGDVVAMEGMIKALESLSAAGEEIDEPELQRAKDQLEASRGEVDYRRRMESIKNALARTIAAQNIQQTEDLIGQMSVLAEDQEYTMTADDSRVLDEARTTLNTMKTKAALVDEIAKVKPDLSLTLIPPNLQPLQQAIGRMSVAKVQAEPFPDVFTEEDAVLLSDAKVNASVLENKVDAMTAARQQLDLAVEKRDYTDLKHAIRNAIDAPFIEKKEIIEPRKLAVFLDPKARRMAVKKAMRSRDIPALEIALQDFKDAKIDDEALFIKGERTLDKLKKREKRRAKQERKKEREDARRNEEIAHLTRVLEDAMTSRDLEHLQLALEEFEESGYEPEDVPKSMEAEELYDNLKIEDIRQRLTDSIQRRDVTGLENAIDDADYGGYVMDVKAEYDIAKDLLYHLRELKRLQEKISDMNRSLISEIHKYPTPPPVVHQVMTAVFVLLGESPTQMKKWNEVQSLLGKLGQNAITRRVRMCVPGDIPAKAVKQAEQQLRGLNLDELSEISKGAATFFAWSTCIIKEHMQLGSQEKAFADLAPLPEIPGVSDRPVTRVGRFNW